MTDRTSWTGAHTAVHPLLERARQRRTGPPADPTLLGIFLLMGEPTIAELCGLLPLDFIVIDMEAGALGRPEVLRMLQATAAHRLSVIVRVPAHDHHAIEHVLDIGAHGVVVPKVNTVEEAHAVAAATRFPPAGSRGVNPVRASGYFSDLPGYLAHANDTALCLVQVENKTAVDNAEQIASVPGIDGLFIGMADLSMALGQPGVVDGAVIDDVRRTVLAAGRKHGKLAGAFAYSRELARTYCAEGFDVVAAGNDIKLLRENIEDALATIRQRK